jgi:hypothetical protein
MLIHMYQQAIKMQIAQQIILAGAPKTINAWMSKAAEIDSAYRRSNHLFAKGLNRGPFHQKREPWKPKFSRPTRDPNAMDVDAVRTDNKGQQGRERKQRIP